MATTPEMEEADLLVIGAGPGGYPAAFRAADNGLRVVLADDGAAPGGVCLHRGCIPSKSLLHAAGLLTLADEAAACGVHFAAPRVDLDELRAWRQAVIDRQARGLAHGIKQRQIRWLSGRVRLTGPRTAELQAAGGATLPLRFRQAIVATGSLPVDPGFGVGEGRVMDATGALALRDIPGRLLVIGGGYIGLELGQAYAALGSAVTVVEMTESLLPGVDRDLVAVLTRRLGRRFREILLATRVAELREEEREVTVRFEGGAAPAEPRAYDRVLVAVGRRPQTAAVGLERTAARRDARGFVVVDGQRRTAEPTIFAVGDAAGQPMLAHKATAEAQVAVEVILGRKRSYDPRAIPAVVFTDPELAWCGLTEGGAAAEGRELHVRRFNWAASGRAATLGRNDGVTKLLCEPGTDRVLGAAVAGPGAGELIAEAVLAIEMGAVAEDLALTIHPHPTLSESFLEAAAAG